MTLKDEYNNCTQSLYQNPLIPIYKVSEVLGDPRFYKVIDCKEIKEKLLNDDKFVLTVDLFEKICVENNITFSK